MDVMQLAASGATAVIAAMSEDAWGWAKDRVARHLGNRDDARSQVEAARLEAFRSELSSEQSSATERDVHNRLHGYLEARLSGDPAAQAAFGELVRQIAQRVRLPVNSTLTAVAPNGIVVQTSGGSPHVVINPHKPQIQWNAMPAVEAARLLGEMDLADALSAITSMEPVLAARRLAFLDAERVEQLLMGMAEESAASMLSMFPEPSAPGQATATSLLSHLDLEKAAAILDLTAAEWTVARLAQMDPERAAVILGAMGSKRRDDLIAAMQSQDTVGLLGALTKVIAEQARARNTLEYLRRQAEQITADAKAEAEAILEAARRERARIEAADDGAADAGAGQPGVGPGSARAVRGRPGGRHAIEGDEPLSLPGRTDLSLPFDYFLLSHDSAGRPQLEQNNLESGTAVAVLIDLIRGGWVRIEQGRPVAMRDSDADDTIVGSSLRAIAAEPFATVLTWVRATRRELFVHVAQHVVDAGVVVPAKRMMGGLVYKRVKEPFANEPAVRVARHLLNPANPPDERTLLLIALIETTQLHAKLPMPLKARQIRELVRGALRTHTTPDYLPEIVAGLDAAIAINTTAPGQRR